LAVTLVTALGLPTGVLANDTGTVAVVVTAASPCVLVSGSFSYGSLPFSTNSGGSMSSQTTGPTVTNCSGTTERILARVSNLANGLVTWTAVPSANLGANATPCPTLNTFALLAGALPDTGPGPLSTYLTSQDQQVGTLTNATPSNWRTVMVMPCVGSDGFGLEMSGQITVTGTF
jgi:hypothetical protein